MVVLKRGDWVLTEDRGIGWVNVVDYTTGYALIEFGEDAVDYSNYLYLPQDLTPLPEGLTPLLLSSNSTGETNE